MSGHQFYPTLEEEKTALQRQKKVLAWLDLNQCEVQPHSWLWRQISPLYKPIYQSDDVIVMTYQGSIPQTLLDHLQKILILLDVSNDFVLILTDDAEFAHKAESSQKLSTDHISMPYRIVQFAATRRPTISTTDFSLPDSICMAPWARLEISPDGTCRPCCVIDRAIKGSDGTVMTVHEHTLEEIYHSQSLNMLRKQFRDGQRPSACQKCWHDEAMGRQSIRQHIAWDLKQDQFNIDWDTESTKNLRTWHLSLGNTCNLKCRICGPGLSSKWSAEILSRLDPVMKKVSPVYQQQKKSAWAENISLPVWADIESTVDNISELRFTGGEPFLLRKQFEVMSRISRTARARFIDLAYVTNGTVAFPEEFVDDLRSYRNVSLSVSIDDIGARFEYQRSGSAWSDLEENFRSFGEMKSRLPNLTLKVNCTVSIMNVFYLPEFLDWLGDHAFDFLRLNVLQTPTDLGISCITENFQKHTLERLQSRTWPEFVKDQIDSICLELQNATLSDGQAFCRKIRDIDLKRNENFADFHREVADLMGYRLLSHHE